MIQTFVNAWKVPELRKKLLFTLMIILLYRIGANLFIDSEYEPTVPSITTSEFCALSVPNIAKTHTIAESNSFFIYLNLIYNSTFL